MTFGKNLVPLSDSHKRTSLATAGWYDPAALSNEFDYREDMFWLGRTLDGQNNPLGYDDDRHVCLVAGTRGGKGASFIINNLCNWPGSCVILDPKGENAAVTARRRGRGSIYAEGMGQSVHVLDPFNIVDLPDEYKSSFNPLNTLDPNSGEAVDEAARLADAMIITGQSKEPFWEESARELVKGIILHVITTERFSSNLITVRRLITGGDWETYDLMEEGGDTDIPSSHKLLLEDMSRNKAFGGVIRGIGTTFLNSSIDSPRTFQSVLQTAVTQTEFLDSEGLRNSLVTSDFKLSDLKTDPKGVSIYLALPQRYMNTHFRWFRMMVTLTITEMEKISGQPAGGHRVLMVLDEFAGLKRMEIIENAVAQMAGFGVKMFYIAQTLPQLKSIYQDNWETLIANAGLKIFFDLEDHFSRDYVSKLIGETEVVRDLHSSSHTKGHSENYSEGESHSHSRSKSTGSSTSGSTTTSSGRSSGGGQGGGHYSSSSGTSHSTSHSTSHTEGESDTHGTNKTRGHGTSDSETRGSSQNLQKTLLITPDEIGRMFARIDDEYSDYYPGLSLVLVTGKPPFPVRRSYYFEDILFTGSFDPHPDHALPPPLYQNIKVGIPGNDLLSHVAYNSDPSQIQITGWYVEEGEEVNMGQPLVQIGPLRDVKAASWPSLPQKQASNFLKLQFPVLKKSWGLVKQAVTWWFGVPVDALSSKTKKIAKKKKPFQLPWLSSKKSPVNKPVKRDDPGHKIYIDIHSPYSGTIQNINLEQNQSILGEGNLFSMSMNRRELVLEDVDAFQALSAHEYFRTLNVTEDTWYRLSRHAERLRQSDATEQARLRAEQAKTIQDKKKKRSRYIKGAFIAIAAIILIVLGALIYKPVTDNADAIVEVVAVLLFVFGGVFVIGYYGHKIYKLYKRFKRRL